MNDNSKKRGNIFNGASNNSTASQKSLKSLKINLSSSKTSFKTAKGQNTLEESKDRINTSLSQSMTKGNNNNNSSKYDHKVLSINLSQISNPNNNSNNPNNNSGKRPNLFNEKSTSRERILTKKSGIHANSNKAGQNSTANTIKTPQFNLTSSQSQQLKKQSQQQQPQQVQSKNQQDILKDFPFLSIQQQVNQHHHASNNNNIIYKNLIPTGGGMNDDLSIQEEQQNEHYGTSDGGNMIMMNKGQRNLQSSLAIMQQQQHLQQQEFLMMREENKGEYGEIMGMRQQPQMYKDFFNGIDVFSQSEVSRSPSAMIMATNKQSAAYMDQDSSINLGSFQSQQSLPNQKKTNQQTKLASNKIVELNYPPKISNNVKHLDLNLSSQIHEDGDSQVISNRQYQNKHANHQQNDPNENESDDDEQYLSAIHDDNPEGEGANQNDNDNFDYITQELQLPMNDLQISRIELGKTANNDNQQFFATTQDDFLLSCINQQNSHAFNRKEERLKTQITQYLLDKILYEQVVPFEIKDLATTSILNFTTMSQGSQLKLVQASETLYEEVLLKNVLIKFLNEFLQVTDNSYESQKALKKYLDEVLIENVNFNLCSEIWNDCLLLPHVMKEDPNLQYQFDLDTRTSEIVHHQQSPQINNAEKIELGSILTQYIEDNLIGEQVDNEIEEIVIQVMQEMIFMKKKIPNMIADEIFTDMLRYQIKANCQVILKKERILNKGAESYLQMFLQEEIGDIIIECQESLNLTPDQVADLAIEKLTQIIPQQMIGKICHEQEENQVFSEIIEDILNTQLEGLILSLAQIGVNQRSNENKVVSKVNDGLIQEVLQNLILDIIIQTVDQDKKILQLSHNMLQNAIDKEIFNVANDCVLEEIANEEYDGIIDKIIEMDIWRGTVKEHNQEEDAMLMLIEEWTDNYTGEFFIDHFSEIKNEYLRNYKEQINKIENSQIKDMSILNISNGQNPFNNGSSALNSSQRLNEISINSSKYQDAQSEVKEYTIIKSTRKRMDFSRRQSNGSNSFINNSGQFQSAASDVFYDCNNDNYEDDDDDGDQNDIINDQILQNLSQQLQEEQQRKMLTGIEEYQEEYNDEDQFYGSYQPHQQLEHRNPRYDTQSSEILDETMQNLEIDEGIKKVTTIQDYYMIPEIKSLDFLNLNQKNFKNYFNQPFEIQKESNYPTMLPIDAMAIDVLCVNCYECVKFDYVDDHSNQCLKNLQQAYDSIVRNTPQKSQNQIKTPYKNYFNDDDNDDGYPEDLGTVLKQDHLINTSQLDYPQNVNLDSSYNFEEGRYMLNEKGNQKNNQKAQEEREFISQLNERIFKLHKAIKEKQIEEQTNLNLNRGAIKASGNDMSLLRHLDHIESLAMNIFTNNSTLVNYQQLMGIYKEDATEILSVLDDDNIANITYQNQNYNQDFSNFLPQRSKSYAPHQFQKKYNLQISAPQTPNEVPDDYFKFLEEEQKQEKAELEIWRNLHNEILKNYLLTKAPLGGNRQVNDINSDVSSKNEQISDNTSTYSSNTGVSSIHNSQFQHVHHRNNSANSTPRGKTVGFLLSPRGGLQTEEDNDVGKLNEVEESLKYKQSEDLKRHFYTLAIHNSKKILKSIPQGTVLKQLYKKCLVEKKRVVKDANTSTVDFEEERDTQKVYDTKSKFERISIDDSKGLLTERGQGQTSPGKKSKLELLKEMRDTFVTPWDLDSPRKFIHIFGSPK